VAGAPEDHEKWMRLIERFQKLRAPEFQGGFDPMVANKWRRDVGNILELMGTDPVQSHRLAASCLKGDARMWYDAHFSPVERTTVTLAVFLGRFDSHFISSAAKAGKEAELIRLEQGELSVTEYESKFLGLCNFTGLFEDPVRQARMFEMGLKNRIRQHVLALSLPTLREVADAALKLEQDFARSKEAATKKDQIAEKGKGKRPFTVVGAGAPVQGGPPGGGPARQRDPAECWNCHQLGHIARRCPMPRQGGQGRGGGGGQGPTPVRGQQQQLRIEAPPARGQANAVYEAPDVRIEPVDADLDAPLPRVYQIGGSSAGGIYILLFICFVYV
jgi:hypothetical protein